MLQYVVVVSALQCVVVWPLGEGEPHVGLNTHCNTLEEETPHAVFVAYHFFLCLSSHLQENAHISLAPFFLFALVRTPPYVHTHTIEFAFSYHCGCVLTRSELLHTAGGSQTNATRRARSWHAYNFTLSPITLDRRCCHGRTSGSQSDAEFQPPAAGGRRAPKKCDRVY